MAVLVKWRGGYECETEVMDSGHVLIGDEPEALGGENKGPNPFALLQMSLANCTVVTLVGVAREKNIQLDDIRVRVVHKQNIKVAGPHDPEQRSLKITELRRHITVKGDIGDEEAEALLWGANHCPVSNTLEGAVPIKTRLEVV